VSALLKQIAEYRGLLERFMGDFSLYFWLFLRAGADTHLLGVR